ncbi:AAA family ATPase [Candidatus Undinarchaeota archaeon]
MISFARLVNWRSHEDSRLEFAKGTNVLIGIIGSGKSSVMDAIAFGLFGTFPAVQSRKLKLEDVLKDKPVIEDSGYVEIGFVANDKEYIVKRKIKRGRGTQTSELRLDGKLIEGPSSVAVTKRVEELMKIDYEVFSRAIYAEQNQMDYFLRIVRGQRMRKIDELLGIDEFDEVRKNSAKLINSFEEQRDGMELVVSEIEELEESQRKDVEKNLDILKKDEERKEKEFDKLKAKKEEIEKRKRDGDADFVKSRELKSKIEILSKEVGDSKKVIDVGEIEKRLACIQKERLEIRKKLDGMIASKVSLENELASMKEEKKEAELVDLECKRILKNNPSIGKDLEIRKNELEKIRNLIPKSESRIEFLDKSLKEFESDNCPLCQTKLDSVKSGSLKKELEKERAGLASKTDADRKRMTVLQIEIPKFEKMVKMLEEGKEASKRLEKIGPVILKLDVDVKRIASAKSGLEKDIEKIESDERSLENDIEISKKRKELGKVDEELEKLGFDNKKYKQVVAEYENVFEEYNLAQVEYNSIRIKREEVEKEIKRIEEKRKEIERQKEKIEEIEKGIEFLAKFQNALKSAQGELRKRFVDNLNRMMSNIWEGLYPYEDFVGARLGIEEGDYVLQLEDINGKWINVEGRVSGGERSSASLVLRMALALGLAPHIRMLILDEPTHNLDKRGIEELAETLRERAAEYIEQVFLITHEEKLEEAVSGNLYRLKRSKKDSGSTVVEEVSDFA